MTHTFNILYPAMTMFTVTFCVWSFMFYKRLQYFRQNNIKTSDLKDPRVFASSAPMDVMCPSDNLKNLFELPVIFYAL